MYKLKKCPFCGSKVKIKKYPLWYGSHGYPGCYQYEIRCNQCGCTLDKSNNNTIYRSDEVARDNVIKAWNTRYKKKKKGHWINSNVPDSMLVKCEICGFDTGACSFNYCPNCGAKMEGYLDIG
jgi:hypothetical protein